MSMIKCSLKPNSKKKRREREKGKECRKKTRRAGERVERMGWT